MGISSVYRVTRTPVDAGAPAALFSTFTLAVQLRAMLEQEEDG